MVRLVLLVVLGAFQVCAQESQFKNFWAAKSPVEAARAADDVVKSGVSFDEAWKRLRAGRTYSAQDSGILQLKNPEHFFAVNVPAGYDPSKKYQVRFQL